MDIQQSQQAKKYLDLFSRRKFFIITLLLLSLPAGLGIYLNSPKVYMATSLLSYQQQRISPNKMSPDVTSRIKEIVSTLSQIIISRRNLEEAILKHNLYPEARKIQPIEDVIEMMRRNIRIQPMKKGNVFTISFFGPLPGNVMKVTNGLAAKFIEENLKYRQERASETSSYTSEELQMAKKGMDEKENIMRDYKLKYYYEMPEQKDTNVRRLIALQEQYQNMQGNLQDRERTLILIQEQMSNRRKAIESAASVNFFVDGKDVEGAAGNAQRLVKMNLVLEQLLLRYTEKHPEVKRTKKLISKLEKKVSLESDAVLPTSLFQHEMDTGVSQKRSSDKIILQLEEQKENVEYQLTNMRQEQDKLKTHIEQYEQWVSSAPVRQAEWSSLTREYGQLKKHYDHLVSRDLQAKSMVNLERKQKGSQFKIEDPARLPVNPVKPDFFKILGRAIAIGLGLGFGLTFFLDLFDTSFRNGDNVALYLGLPLISTIPYINTKKEVKKSKWYAFLSFGFLSCLFFLILALFFYVWRKGLIVI